jgi:hypothetical protein
MQYLLFGIINACGGAPFNLEHWMDGLAVSKSRIYPSAVIEIGDSQIYLSANKKAQALEKISNTDISFKVDLSGLGSGPYYLWVTNNERKTSTPFLLQ